MDLMLRDKIKQECWNQGITLKVFFTRSKLCRNTYYKYFLESWKSKVAFALNVDASVFFKGFEDEIHADKIVQFQENYADNKAKAIETLKNDWATIGKLSEIIGIEHKQVSSMIGNLRYTYIVESRYFKNTYKKEYRIIGTIDKLSNKFSGLLPIEALPSPIYKMDYFSYVIDNKELSFKTSRAAVDYGKQHGKDIVDIIADKLVHL